MSNNDAPSLLQDIAKLRRDQPRNAVTIRVCDALEARLTTVAAVKKALRFDKKAYMRDYMRRYRDTADQE